VPANSDRKMFHHTFLPYWCRVARIRRLIRRAINRDAGDQCAKAPPEAQCDQKGIIALPPRMVGMLKKVTLRGIDKVGWLFTFTGAAYDLCRLRNLMART
jgi:hypothetical protein